jgi:MFS transporter, PAT family, solute carrier family 33 (acetyl-CoA transportor), member 1
LNIFFIRENVSWASTCNCVGQSIGWLIGNILFLVFESESFSNQYIRPLFNLPSNNSGIITISLFMKFFGFVFIVATTCVLLFVKEKDFDDMKDDQRLTIKETYYLILKIVNLRSIKELIFILLTYRLCFGSQALIVLKLIEKGVPKESLGLISLPIVPLEAILPLILSRYTNGPRPLILFAKMIPFRIMTTLLLVFWTFLTPMFYDKTKNEFSGYYYLICILICCLNSTVATVENVTKMAFFSQISDKIIGATYMTILSTISNLGKFLILTRPAFHQ